MTQAKFAGASSDIGVGVLDVVTVVVIVVCESTL